MLDVRTLALAVLLFGATFGGVWWWTGSGTATATIGSPLSPVTADEPPPPFKVDVKEDASLRQAVVDTAMTYRRSQCSDNAKARYIVAATNYADRLMRSAGCRDYTCRGPASRLEQVWRVNRTPEDQAVAEAMGAVNAKGGVLERDFPGHVGRAVRVIAGSDFRQGPSCVASTRRRWAGGGFTYPSRSGRAEPEETRKDGRADTKRSSFRFRFRRR
jgi:hypothetical protein